MDVSPTEGYTFLGAALTALVAFLYKIFRIFKIDRNQDSLNQDEEDFRKSLLAENKSLRDLNHTLYIEKADLLSKIARVESELSWLKKQIDYLEHPDNSRRGN